MRRKRGVPHRRISGSISGRKEAMAITALTVAIPINRGMKFL
jgi:hypothetical protein